MSAKRAQSKRLSTRHRAKVVRKVKEHHRKVRKEARLNPHKKSAKKDPGIPSMWPFKESLLQKLQADREKEKDQRTLAKLAAPKEAEKLELLAAQAAAKAIVYKPIGAESGSRAAPSYTDSSKKAYYKEFKQVVEAADVILEVLDARDPIGCRIKAIEEMIMNHGSNKRIVLVLNKIDLVPRPVVEAWLKHLRREFPTIAFKASTQAQRSNIGQKSSSASMSDSLLNVSECLGADTLIQLLKNYCRSINIKTSVTVGVVGYPNVGKSSLINSLKRSKVCNVGSTPGVTTVRQEIHLDKNIKLLDCPGIVFSSDQSTDADADVFLRNCLKVEQLADPVTPVLSIVERCAAEQLMLIYGIPAFTNGQEFLFNVAKRLGKLRKGGVPNVEAAARAILNDWNMGKIPYHTLPPASRSELVGSATVVANWAPEFDLDSIEKMEIDNVLSNVPGKVAFSMAIDTMAEQGGEMDIEEEDNVSAAPAAKPLLVIGGKVNTQKRSAIKDDAPALTPDEAAINPQANKQRQKLLKQGKKLAAKSQKKHVTFSLSGKDGDAALSSQNNNSDEDEYDFGTDFAPLPGQRK